MTRNLEFDYATAIDHATRLFWETGYSGTSLRDLLRKMEIGEGSFYNTFKSKKSAYLECLKHYNATIGRERGEALLSAPTAAMGIRALFKLFLDCLDDPSTPTVCLFARTITPEVLAESELNEHIQSRISEGSERMIARLNADKDSGLLPVDFHPEIVTPIIVTYIQGMWRMALLSYDRTQFERQIDLFLTSLGL
jgi:TetR/AcrR family transcriptional repressor of nem operon